MPSTTQSADGASATEEQMQLIKRTLPLLEKNSYAIAVELYVEAFKIDSSLKNIFSLDFICPKGALLSEWSKYQHGLAEPLSSQARILSQTIFQLAANIKHTHEHDVNVDRIGCKHVSRGVRPEHYEVIKRAFGLSLTKVLGPKLTEEEHDAWSVAVCELSRTLINHEQNMREQARSKRGVRWSIALNQIRQLVTLPPMKLILREPE
jgi:nitric oxide dioxygenase